MSDPRFMKITPFRVQHGLQMKVREEERMFRSHDDFKHWLQVLEREGQSYSAFFDDEVIFVGGIRIILPHVGEGWVICAENIGQFVRELYYYVRHILDVLTNIYDLHRVQAHVKTNWKSACHFVERLGFEKEGLLKKYILGEDYYIYARIR